MGEVVGFVLQKLPQNFARVANLSFVKELKIPLPDLSEQKEIVQKLLNIESIIEGNKRLIEIYNQKIQDKISKVWRK